MARAKIQFYEVTTCGYQKARGRDVQFGSFSSAATELAQWLSSRKGIALTATTGSEDGASHLPIYGFSMNPLNSKTSQAVLSLWNQVETDYAGNFGSVERSSPVGRARVHNSKPPNNSIPGVASHYWLLPSRNLVATIKFDWQQPRVSAITRYFKGFLELYSHHAVLSDPAIADARRTYVLGYRESDDSDIQHNLLPRFSISRVRVQANLKEIRANRSSITAIIHKRDGDFKYGPDVTLLRRIFSRLHIGEPPLAREQGITYTTNVEYCPSAEELEHIIDAFASGGDEEKLTEGVNDVGFKIGEHTVWLSRALSRHERDLDIRLESGVASGDSLAKAIKAHSRELLKEVNRQRLREELQS